MSNLPDNAAREHATRAQPRSASPAFEDLAERFHRGAVSKRRFRKRVRLGLIVGDLLIIGGAIYAWAFGYMPGPQAENTVAVLGSVTLPLYFILATSLKGYNFLTTPRIGVPITPPLAALIGSVAGAILFLFLTKYGSISRVVVVGSSMTSFIGLVIFRSIMSYLVSRNRTSAQLATLCLYDGVPVVVRSNSSQIDASAHGLSADASNPEMIRRLAEISRDFDNLVIHCTFDRRQDWLLVTRSLSMSCELVVPELNDISPIGLGHRAGNVSAVISRGPLHLYQRAQKRAFDLVFVIALLPFLLPTTLLIAILVKLDSKGPVFFVQDRIGRDNRPFRIFKFRSMTVEQLDFDGARSTARADARVTRMGNFLRRTSLDELPQLYNVLWGDMSVVGPRPHAHLSRAGDKLFWEIDSAYWMRHSVKPGITGLAQIRGFRGTTFHEDHLKNRLNADLEYVAEWSLLSDLKIVLLTFSVLIHKNAF